MDLKDFVQYERVISGIKNGKPIVKNLKYVDEAIKNNYSIGILTARSNQKAVYDAMKTMLLHKNDKGEFEQISSKLFKKKYCIAISDPGNEEYYDRKTKEGKHEDKKAFAIKKFFQDLYGFEKIVFFDDDPKNVKAVEKLFDKNIKAVQV